MTFAEFPAYLKFDHKNVCILARLASSNASFKFKRAKDNLQGDGDAARIIVTRVLQLIGTIAYDRATDEIAQAVDLSDRRPDADRHPPLASHSVCSLFSWSTALHP